MCVIYSKYNMIRKITTLYLYYGFTLHCYVIRSDVFTVSAYRHCDHNFRTPPLTFFSIDTIPPPLEPLPVDTPIPTILGSSKASGLPFSLHRQD